jgi:hypothetical protein
MTEEFGKNDGNGIQKDVQISRKDNTTEVMGDFPITFEIWRG